LDETSNARNVLDPALTRRFDRTILVDLPTKEDRQRYLEYLLQKRSGHQMTQLMVERIASRAAGLTLANLETIMELAARNAAKKNQPLDDNIFEEAFEVSQHGDAKNWGLEYLERVARHEAGHAYICHLEKSTPNYLTIIARGGHGGYMEYSDVEDKPLQTRDDLLARIRSALGGRAAELVYYGEEQGLSSGASPDSSNATNIAKAMLIHYGMDDGFGLASISSEEAEKGPLATEILRKTNVILQKQLVETVGLIREGKQSIDRLVAALLEKNKLSKEEMETILR